MMDKATTVTNPFPGLRPFQEDEDYLFFGRERQVDTLVNKLAETRFLAVVGASGSGKSSLVNCGLRPALHRGLLADAGSNWRMAQFRPGSNPVHGLARALAVDGVLFKDYQAGALTLTEIVESTLRMSTVGLIDIFEQANLEDGVNLLVVADQFEELFRYQQIGDGDDRNLEGYTQEDIQFVNLLLEVKKSTNYPIYVVLTMRSDFLGDCTHFPGLAEAINEGQYLVPRLTRDERRSAISGPAAVCGAEISPVLLTRLVNDVGDNPDQLSILQHALNRTWYRWSDSGNNRPLDLPDYEAIGTMAGALDRHAEKAFGELTAPRQQEICERVFKALTDKANDPRGVRRPTTLRSLCTLTGATQSEVVEVIDVFRKPSRSFLMPPAGDVLEAETVIDISHESLMRVWERLVTWTDEEAQSAQIYRRLAETAVLNSRNEAGLWQDPDLELALKWQEDSKPNEVWAQRYHTEFGTAMGFLDKSKAARSRRRALKIGAAAAIFLILATALVFSSFGWTFAEAAKSEAEAAKAQAEEAKIEAEKRKDELSEINIESEKTKNELITVVENLKNLETKSASISQALEKLKKEQEFTIGSRVSVKYADRTMTYSNISLNNQGNSIDVRPGGEVTIEFSWKLTYPPDGKCPGCIVQFYFGLGPTTGFSQMFFDARTPPGEQVGEVRGYKFSAPTKAGRYYITSAGSLEFESKPNIANHLNQKERAIAVIVVR